MPRDYQAEIARACDDVKKLLLSKNRAYGSSAFEPSRVFSKASAVEQVLVRVDDKLSRIKTSGLSAPDEDTLQDLIGYLVILKILVSSKSDTDQDINNKPSTSYAEAVGRYITHKTSVRFTNDE